MLVLLWELSKFDFATPDQTMRDALDEFQEILVDYIAAAHFGLYERIAEGQERRQPVLEKAREIYPQIARSTDIAVEFTEKYDAASEALITTKLESDLSLLAEEITSRIELEDQLIMSMLGHDFPIPQVPSKP